jgi:hypothetical protein
MTAEEWDEAHFGELVAQLHTHVELFARAYRRANQSGPQRMPLSVPLPALRDAFANFLLTGRLTEPKL